MRLVLVGLSVRLMAEAVARGGDEAIALDVFGDADTSRASVRWVGIRRPGSLGIDADRLLAALGQVAGDVDGWIAGSGFEGALDLLERAAGIAPLIGTSPAALRRLLEPRGFFAALQQRGIAHPETRFEPPDDAAGWLVKDAASCGGWHVRAVSDVTSAAITPTTYWQRDTAGEPMSATFIANGECAVVLGFNRQLTRAVGARRHVFRGVIGPLPLHPPVAQRLAADIDTLTRDFDLRGLCSLDFLLDGTQAQVLEINARPPASMGLYRHAVDLMPAHVRACLRAELPARGDITPTSRVEGHEIVFAHRPLRLDDRETMLIAARGDCHDLPMPGSAFEIDEPVCSMSARGVDAAAVIAQLERTRRQLTTVLETCS